MNAGQVLSYRPRGKVSERLEHRNSDTPRLGGDEFTVILHAVPDSAHIRTVAEKIVQALATSFQIHENSVQVSASIGVSSSPKDAQTPIVDAQR